MRHPARTEPGPGQESVWDYPRPPAVEPVPERVVVRLDLTEARPVAPVVELSLDLNGSSVTVIVPPGASASVHRVDLTASTARARVPESGGLHIVATGQLRGASLIVRPQRRFLWWRW